MKENCESRRKEMVGISSRIQEETGTSYREITSLRLPFYKDGIIFVILVKRL